MPTPAERLSTAISDRYRIERHLGEGGMATVYLAHDLKHDRKVALKVLRPELAAVIGAERFLAEIKTTANLQHPNILPLFDSGDADGQLFYVMPYVEGETLRDRIIHEKQLPVDDVVRMGAEVASALDYAHRQGVIHRDIKPENILVHDGRALVADFGIALAVSTAGSRMTETGMSVGTPHYMSPEQAMGGHDVTAKSDVYALGATLYEALVGEPPFTGSTAQAVIARIVTEEPRPLRTQRKTIPAHVEGAVLTALQRLPADRFATAAEFGDALEGRGRVPTRISAGAVSGSAGRDAGLRVSRPVAGVAAAGVLALAAAALWGWLRPQLAPPLSRETVVLGPAGIPGFIGATAAVAPDGSAIVYGDTVGGEKLWIKERGELNARPLVSLTDLSGGGVNPGPSFSPDGRWILYSDGPLMRVARDGGAPVVVSDSASRYGGAWLDDGTVAFIGRNSDRLFRTTADGGPTARVLTADSAGGLLGRVAPIPGTNAVLVSLAGTASGGGGWVIMAFDLSTRSMHEIARGSLAAWVLPGGDIAYVQANGSVFAAHFDASKLELDDAPVSVLDSVRVSGQFADIAMGADGTMFYSQGAAMSGGTSLELVALSRDGGREHRVDSTWSAPITVNGGLALSPDGSQVAISVSDTTGNRDDIYVLHLPDGPATRLTFEGTSNIRPAWSPDGKTILYTSDASGDGGKSSDGGKRNLWSRRADGSGRPVRVVSEARGVWEGLWSPDGKWLVYRTDDVAAGSGDILAKTTSGDTTPVPLVATPAEETGPALSPDGRWLAYASNVTGRKEVYVVPFPAAQDGKWQVSFDGGSEPLWSHDGRELFYRNASGQAIAVDVSGTPTFNPGAHHTLFNARDYQANDDSHFWAVTPDASTFVMLRPVAPVHGTAVTTGRTILVRNWLPEIEARLKGG